MRTIALFIALAAAACSDGPIDDEESFATVGIAADVAEGAAVAEAIEPDLICDPPAEATCGYNGLPCCAKDGQGGTGGSLDPNAHCVDGLDVVWNPGCSGTP